MSREDMTVREIAGEIYSRNKKFIYLYIGIVTVIVVSTFLMHTIDAGAGTSCVRAMDNAMVSQKQGIMLGGSVYGGIISAANSMGAAIEPISILFVEAVVSLLGKFFDGKFSSFVESVGVMNNEVVCYIIIVLFVLLKIIRSNNFTKITGLVAEDIENKIGIIVSAASPFLYYFGMNSSSFAYAAEIQKDGLKSGLNSGLSIIVVAVFSIAMVITYYVVRKIVYAAEIVLVPFSAIPFVSGLIELVKTICVIIMVFLVVNAPVISLLIYGIVFAVCLLLFKKAYVTVRYFKAIYVAPFFRRKDKMLIDTNKTEKYLTEEEIGSEKLFFPAFAHNRINEKIGKYDKCWLYVKGEGLLVCKPKFWKRELLRYPLCKIAEEEYFLNKNFWYIEIFKLNKEDVNLIHYNPLRLKKSMHFIISREYVGRFNELSQVLQFKNYKEHQQELKRRKKEEKYEQRLREQGKWNFFRKSNHKCM